MELVVDTNILYSFFWKSSLTKKLLMKMNLELFSPEFALEEINLHISDILKKTKLSEEEFTYVRKDLAIAVSFIPLEEYSKLLKQASKISPDSEDIDFLALALKLKLPLWSNDVELKKQNKVVIFSTSELLENLEFKKAVSSEE